MRCAGPQFRSDVALHDVSWVRKCELLARGEGRLQQRPEGAQPSNGLGRRGNYAVALEGAVGSWMPQIGLSLALRVLV